jgi:hypothetical protein
MNNNRLDYQWKRFFGDVIWLDDNAVYHFWHFAESNQPKQQGERQLL